MQNYRLNIFELPKIEVTTDNGTKVLIKSAIDESAKYNRIKTYMLYIPTKKSGLYRVLVANWDPNFEIPSGKINIVDVVNKIKKFDSIATADKRQNAANLIRKYEEIVANHRRKSVSANTATIASTANPEDEAYSEEAAV